MKEFAFIKILPLSNWTLIPKIFQHPHILSSQEKKKKQQTTHTNTTFASFSNTQCKKIHSYPLLFHSQNKAFLPMPHPLTCLQAWRIVIIVTINLCKYLFSIHPFGIFMDYATKYQPSLLWIVCKTSTDGACWNQFVKRLPIGQTVA